MKKLLALLTAAMLVFTACGSAAKSYTGHIDEKIYESFTFDETAIDYSEEHPFETDGMYAVSGDDNPNEWYEVDDFDSRGKILRTTRYTDSTKTKVHTTTEYSYADHGYYTKNTQPSDTSLSMVTFTYYSRDGLYKDEWYFTHIAPPGEVYGLNFRTETEKSADGKTTTSTSYDMNNTEVQRRIIEKDDRDTIIKATYYKNGVIDTVEEYDWQAFEAKVTVYKDGKPLYVKVTNNSGFSYDYYDLDGNPIDRPPLTH